SDGFNLLHPLRGDVPSSLREGFEAVLQRERHAFKQTSMRHVREGMPVQNSMEIGCEIHSASDLTQASEEDPSVGHLRVGRKILGVARIAYDCSGSDAPQQKRRRGET